MRHRILGSLLFALVSATGLAAANFWDTKPFLDWSDHEVEQMLTDSPWTSLIALPLPNRAPVPTGDDGGGRGGRGGGGERGFGPGPVRARITISWRSALPLKQALVRQQVGRRGTVPPQAQTYLDTPDDHYIVALQGLPPQYTMPGRGQEAVEVTALLKRRGKPPIPVQQATPQVTRGGFIMLLRFPKADPIMLADESVELDAKFGQLQSIRKKFKLKDLVYAGSLAL